MRKKVDALVGYIDAVTGWFGNIAMYIIPVIMLIISYEVIARYFFQAPTIWAWDINVQLLALMVFFGGGYVLLHDGHVRVDILYSELPKRWRAIVDLITCPIFFIYLFVLVWKFFVMTKASLIEREVTSSLFAPPVYPLKILCSIALIIFFMEGISKFIRNLQIVIGSGDNDLKQEHDTKK